MAPRDIAIPGDAGAVLVIDLDAIAENYRLIQNQCPGVAVGAAVKADAYGLGLEPVTRTLAAAGCATFFVATVGEGRSLRGILPDADIVVLNGPEEDNLEIFAGFRLTPTLNSLPQIDVWSAGGVPQPAWLHIDTGMNRLGLGPGDVEALIERPDQLSGVEISTVMSHLACADDPGDPMNDAQRDRFVVARDRLAALTGPVRASLANSPGVFLGPDYHFDMVRPGAALYGLNPAPESPNPMRQVVEIHTKILQLRDVDTPMTVGYGAAHRVTGTGRIATLAAGYADGYPRAAGNTQGSSVCAYIAGQPAPVVGRISMDLITIDVSNFPVEQVQPGQTVELLGPNVSPDTLAEAGSTIGYEVLSQLGSRLHREYRSNRV